MLTDSQMMRMGLESSILTIELPGFTLYYSQYSDPYAAGWVTTTVDCNVYELQLEIGPSCLDTKPKLYVTYPTVLRGYCHHKTINQRGISHDFHTWENGPLGCVQICHKFLWDASRTCVSVIQKGILWLELYEAYLRDGKTIAAHCH